MLKNILRWIGAVHGKKRKRGHIVPQIIPRADHRVSRNNISRFAVKVLYRLRDAGYEAYLVGGGVRDVLLGLHPKDFDVATNAKPEQIQRLFQNCRLIGRRFRLAHIHFGSHIVEVATFRAKATSDKHFTADRMHSEEGMILRDNTYGTLEEDVFRRDFTVNGLYYNIADFSVVDYVGGMQDLKDRCLRMIGNPNQRYREDPVRMLRVIRFAAKLGFEVEKCTEAPIFELAPLVKQVPSARLLDEYIKLFLSGYAEKSYELLRHYQIFPILFPATEECLKNETARITQNFIRSALIETDKRVSEQKPVVLPFLLAAFLWYPLQHQMKQFIQEGLPEIAAFHEACDVVLQRQQSTVAISRRLTQAIREIWLLQFRLAKRIGKRVLQVSLHPRFRAAYDFLRLRALAGEEGIPELAEWWDKYTAADDEAKALMRDGLKSEPRRYRRKRQKSV